MQRIEVNGCTLYHADCMEALAEIDKVDCILTDPPYGVAYKTNYRKRMATPAMLKNDKRPPVFFVPPIMRKLRAGGACYLFTTFIVMPEWQTALSYSGMRVKTPIIWDKGNHTAGDCEGDYGCQVEVILFATKGRHLFVSGKREANLWRVMRDPAGEHPTPKPVVLLEKIIRQSTRPGDLVFDPFMGSGSTGVACVRTGRRFIGIEIEKNYFELSARRISEARRRMDMFDDAAPAKQTLALL